MRVGRQTAPSVRRLLAVAVALVAVAAPAAGASKDPGPGSTGPPYSGPYRAGSPAPDPPKQERVAPPPRAVRECTLPRPGRATRDEWTTCFQVTAELSRAPAVGETAVLDVTAVAQYATEEADFTVELPPQLEFVDPPAGARVGTAPSADRRVPVPRASRKLDLPADVPVALRAVVRAVSEGHGHLRVRVVKPVGAGDVDAGSADVFLTVGRTESESRFGIELPAVGRTTEIADSPEPRAVRGEPHAAPLPRSQPATAEPAGVAGTACAAGGWFFVDHEGTTRPSINFQVQAWDDDSASGDDLLVAGTTAFDGSYELCFDNTDGEGGTQDVYVRFLSENALWRVQDNDSTNLYTFATGVVSNVPDGTTSFGNRQPADGSVHRALHAFDAINSAWFWQGGGCWDVSETSCRQMRANWAPDSTMGTYYCTVTGSGCPRADEFYLAADDPNSRILVQHELGHGVMDDVYNDDFPPSPSCNPHPIRGATSAGCAWTEGWAEWYPAMIENEKLFRWADGMTRNLETPTWGDPDWPFDGDTVEGHVAGALIDISDPGTESLWDSYGEGDPGPVWTTFQNRISDTFAEFFDTDRAADGFDTTDSGARASVYQNTIDYGFRNPLQNYVELTRPTPRPHNYSYNTTTSFFSAVAIRPLGGLDYDLRLYDDRAQTTLLETSALGASTVDFVWVDSNVRPLGDFYPQVLQNVGTGNYAIELAQGASSIADGTFVVSVSPDDIVHVRDTFLNAGVPTAFRVVPSVLLDVELFLLGASGSDPIGRRSTATRSSSFAGFGEAEQFLYTPGVSDWNGVLVVSKGGLGSFTLYRDTSAPTGGVTINAGAAVTNNRNVTLSLSATDAHTGIEAMQISTDGALDSEPFIAFAATAPVTLPTGDGTKTVRVRYRNNAGLVSAIVSDTIVLDQTPPVTSAGLSGTGTGCTDTFFGTVTVALSATDARGVASTEYRLDGGAFQAYGGPFGVAAKRAHTLEFRSTDNVGNVEAPKTRLFTNGPFLVAAKTAVPTKTLSVTGRAFQAGEAVRVRWDGAVLASPTASSSTCDFTVNVTVPESTNGNHTLSLVGVTSGQTASQTVKIKPLGKVSPTSGPSGSTASFTGYGYRGGETVQVRWSTASGTLLASGTANSVGTVGPLSFTVPSAALGTYTVFGVGMTSGATAKAKFKVV